MLTTPGETDELSKASTMVPCEDFAGQVGSMYTSTTLGIVDVESPTKKVPDP